MKKILLIFLLVPCLSFGQTLKETIKKTFIKFYIIKTYRDVRLDERTRFVIASEVGGFL